MKLLKQILTAAALTLLIFSAAAVITLNFKPLYYADMQKYNLSERFGYPEDEIKANYDVMVDFNNFWNKEDLVFPTLPMSDNAHTHFVEVREIFVVIETVLLPIGLVGGIVGVILSRKDTHKLYLLLTSVFSVAIPAVLGGLIAANWDTFFTKFHEMFFNNDYWIFDSATDPIIDLLPDEFFLHCCVLILIIILACAVISLLLYARNRKKTALSR